MTIIISLGISSMLIAAAFIFKSRWFKSKKLNKVKKQDGVYVPISYNEDRDVVEMMLIK